MLKTIVPFCSIIAIFPGFCFPAATCRLVRNPIPLYEVAEVEFTIEANVSQPFQFDSPLLQLTSPTGKKLALSGFYYGVDTEGQQLWRIRAAAREIGRWDFSWSFAGASGDGHFTCSTQENSFLHGHLRIDPDNPHKLRFEDGTPLYWLGGKYLCFMRPFGSADLQDLSYPERLSNSEYLPQVKRYLAEIAALGLNGVLIKISVLPLNYDLQSMNLEFFAYLDQIVLEAQKVGINIQLNLFDSWGKRKEEADWAEPYPPNGVYDLLLEPWNPKTYIEATRFYLRYTISRYAAYGHLHWELWNEAQRFKVSALEATKAYLPWMREYDPYDLLVGASEMYTGPYPCDLTFPHGSYKATTDQWEYTHNKTLTDPNGYANGKPLIWNEIRPYDGDSPEQEYDWFRAQFWGLFTAGNAGVADVCWTDIRQVPNRITEYLSHHARFVQNLHQPNRLEPADELIDGGQASAWLCQQSGKEAVAYLYTQQNSSQVDFRIYFQPGNYACRFYDPKTGEFVTETETRHFSTAGWKSFTTPHFNQDLVFYALEEACGHNTPVELSSFHAMQQGFSIVLEWETLSESNNYGFEIQRAEILSDFSVIGFCHGHGTTQNHNSYRIVDQPVQKGWYRYRLRQIDLDGTSTFSPVVEVNLIVAAGETHASPNPSHGPVTIRFSVAEPTTIELQIININGQIVHQAQQDFGPGTNHFDWTGPAESARSFTSGPYFYVLRKKGEANPANWMRGKLLLIN